MATKAENIGRMKQTTGATGLSYTLENIGAIIMRYSVVLILLWIGALKFTAYEAEGIQGFVANSPLTSWLYSVLSLRGVSMLFGVCEILFALLIATRPFAPSISAIGSLGAIFTFLTTLTFLATTPGMWQEGYGFPALTLTSSFLVKDLTLLGISVWSAGEALQAANRQNA